MYSITALFGGGGAWEWHPRVIGDVPRHSMGIIRLEPVLAVADCVWCRLLGTWKAKYENEGRKCNPGIGSLRRQSFMRLYAAVLLKVV